MNLLAFYQSVKTTGCYQNEEWGMGSREEGIGNGDREWKNENGI